MPGTLTAVIGVTGFKRIRLTKALSDMTFDLAEALPRLLPRAIAWAEARCAEVCAQGTCLDNDGLRLARAVGVGHPEQIRTMLVKCLPMPEDAELREAALATGLLGPDGIGLTLGYGIYLRADSLGNRLLSHECRHVHQYETAGSIAAYLPAYLEQIVTCGYERAPFEIDARSHERDVV